ncbi:MAG: hypothetical protein RLZZ385_1858 [Pseudomonadota bacterium]|jgi:hypothetical protein
MLDHFYKVAMRVQRLLPLLLVVALLALVLAVWVVVESARGSDDSLFIPALLVFSWCVLLLIFSKLFLVVPAAPTGREKFFRRLSIKFRRSLLAILALAFGALTLALLIVSFKLLAL